MKQVLDVLPRENREMRVVDFNPNLEALLKDMQMRRAPDIDWIFPSPQRGERDEAAKRCVDVGMQMDLRSGFRFERQTLDSLLTTEDAVEGVNAFREKEETGPPLLTINPRLEEEQVERLRAFRAARDRRTCEESLEQLKTAAREERNLVPSILQAVESSATLGEVIGALKTVWGEYRPGT